MMTAAPGQLCSRARFWASLRVDGELSELEGALLDAHLGRCADCRDYAAGVVGATAALRNTPLVAATPIVVDVPAGPGRSSPAVRGDTRRPGGSRAASSAATSRWLDRR
jgi:anti-sigma factor RsiW